MAECSFCGREFDTSKELGDHIEKEHRDEAEEEMTPRWNKKTFAVKYSFAGIVLVGAALLIPQILSEAPTTLETGERPLNLSENPLLGDEDAAVSVVMFGDYKCSSCADISSLLTDESREEFIESGKVKFYFLNYNYLETRNGDSSTSAAVAGECVYRQDKNEFWRFHTALYRNQGDVTQDWATEKYLTNIAQESTSELNYTALRDCISSRETLEEVNSDKEAGIALNVGQTPSVFVNGEKISDPSRETVRARIKEELSGNESEKDN